jgi:hypothetical protein
MTAETDDQERTLDVVLAELGDAFDELRQLVRQRTADFRPVGA